MSTSRVGTWAGQLRSLRPVLESWTRLVVRSADAWARGTEPDCPWWYRERPLVGYLAAAAFMTGGTALEEYSDNKGVGADDSYTGRRDLFLGTSSVEYLVEAKFAWSRAALSKSVVRARLKAKMAKAVEDALSIRSVSEKRLAVVFAAPFIKESDPETMVGVLAEWRRIVDQFPSHAQAWAFPKSGWQMKYGGFVHPGVVLLARKVTGRAT